MKDIKERKVIFSHPSSFFHVSHPSSSPHFSQTSVARSFKRRPIRLRGLKGAAGILDSMSKSLEGAKPYGASVVGRTRSTELCEKCGLARTSKLTDFRVVIFKKNPLFLET